MRRLLLPMLALAALCVGSIALASATATKSVKITRTAFSPKSTTIKSGDGVKWTNSDTINHQVVSNNGSFVSPVLAPKRTYSHTFNTAGTYRYHDGLHPTLTGVIKVTGPPPAVTIGASVPIIVYGQKVTLSGVVSNKAAGESVTVYQQPYGQASFQALPTILTTTGGVWSIPVTPLLLTSYQAKWKSTTSATISVAVQPRIRFQKITRGRFGVHVYGDHSFGGHWVYIQRFSRFGQWVAIRKVTLGSGSGRAFKLRLPRGVSSLRAFMTVNQAGPGYLQGLSPVIKVRRR